LTVDQARTRLMSSLAAPMMQPISNVIAPTLTTTSSTAVFAAQMGLEGALRYTPAVTMVAAWMSADTGVGPSMASGNHACSGNWPDLPQAPSNSRRPMMRIVVELSALRPLNTSSYWTVPSVANIRNIAVPRPGPPARFIRNAFLPAVAALGRSYQNAISRYDARPTPSQPK